MTKYVRIADKNIPKFPKIIIFYLPNFCAIIPEKSDDDSDPIVPIVET